MHANSVKFLARVKLVESEYVRPGWHSFNVSFSGALIGQWSQGSAASPREVLTGCGSNHPQDLKWLDHVWIWKCRSCGQWRGHPVVLSWVSAKVRLNGSYVDSFFPHSNPTVFTTRVMRRTACRVWSLWVSKRLGHFSVCWPFM